ncbi:hypothetical protein GDO86_018032 [Hymenochirus boettgeri]|uniref:G-protein coupled receptors family 1 profile domain-containing protein n=1 Tax=Hymenochirus boettgeri TaxID=247094 RepID=A0A8T2IGW0_9PIPI|nr:hypothetical protein GDO86_018032 [Hymenochirus boettgeri]
MTRLLPPKMYLFTQAFSIICLSVTCITGIIGNGLVIWIAGFKMKTITATWYLHLAITDFICSLSTLVRIAEWILPGGIRLCLISFTILLLNVLTSVYFLTAISVDRCISIIWPIWAKIHRTQRSATTTVRIIWVVSLLLCISSLFLGYDFVSFHNPTCCVPMRHQYYFVYKLSEAEKSEYLNDPINICRFVFMFLLPFAIILLCNGLIVCRLVFTKIPNRSQRPLKIITAIVICFFWLLVPVQPLEIH